MALTCRFTSDGLGIISEYTGDVTDQDLRDACDFRIEHLEQMKHIRYNIADYRGTQTFNISPDTVRNVALVAKEAVMPFLSDVFYVAVVKDDIQFGTMRMWSSFSSHTNINNIVVKDEQLALQRIQLHLEKLGIEAKIEWA